MSDRVTAASAYLYFSNRKFLRVERAENGVWNWQFMTSQGKSTKTGSVTGDTIEQAITAAIEDAGVEDWSYGD